MVEDVKRAAVIAHRRGALLVMGFSEAVSLGILEPPQADIVAGELQSFAITPSYGGPYAGIIATREKFARQMPGRVLLAARRHRDGPTVRDAARVDDAHARIVAVRDEPSDVFEIGAGA